MFSSSNTNHVPLPFQPLLLGVLWLCLALGHSVSIGGNHQQQQQRFKRGLLSTLVGLKGSQGGIGGISGSSILNSIKEPDSDELAAASKPKPYEFNELEMTAIQAMVAVRDIIGDLMHRVGFNLPSSLASLITRSETSEDDKVNLSGDTSSGVTKAANVGVLLRGLALSLPLLIPMATQIRRMSTDTPMVVPRFAQLPFVPDPYYNQALHRRRGRRSVQTLTPERARSTIEQLEQVERILRYLRQMEEKYGQQQ